jgi:hypothetical protein
VQKAISPCALYLLVCPPCRPWTGLAGPVSFAGIEGGLAALPNGQGYPLAAEQGARREIDWVFKETAKSNALTCA